MKFFTPEYFFRDDNDSVVEEYRVYITKILPLLSTEVAELSKIYLHDGTVISAKIDHKSKRLQLVLYCFQERTGYFVLSLNYSGVDIDTLNVNVLRERALDTRSEILADEIDVTRDSRFIHRILFWPEGEIVIIFNHLTIDIMPSDYHPHHQLTYEEV